MQEKKVTRRELFRGTAEAAAAGTVAGIAVDYPASPVKPPDVVQVKAISWPAAVPADSPPSVLVRYDFIDGEWRPCCPVEIIDRLAREDPSSLISCEMRAMGIATQATATSSA